ncbi:MAG TPA: LamG domain-containing protein [Sedimentisphaerales bacterium]|nr:LamG domain-containing protein [Sedimentisphaerales bacterium]
MRKLIFGCLIGALLFNAAPAADDGPTAWWKFDEGRGSTALDTGSAVKDKIEGNFKFIDGVSGSAIKLDGFTTRVVRRAADAPRLTDEFTVESWIAPQAYPWNWCAIVNQEKDHKAGYFFGIDVIGHVGLHLAVDGKWYECTTDGTVPFMEKWSHIAGTFSKDDGIRVYIDGKVAASMPIEGGFDYAADMDLQIGRNHKKTLLDPAALVRKEVNFPTSYSFDGIIDEVKIYNRSLTREEIAKNYQASKPKGAPPLEWRKLPQLPAGGDSFGAVYCRLKFYQEWDALWRVADHPDVVVTFDEDAYKMVFWRGTNFNMNLVTETGIWVGDQSAEGGGPAGCAEHMSDKQCRFAHVRVIENHDARVVVHWRYAIVDVMYNNGAGDPVTDWGTWADEYYYIYPDGIATRNFFVHGMSGFSVTEPTVLNNPGQKAEDNISLDAVTLANMEGQTRTYNWDTWPGNEQGRFKDPIPNANVCIVNLKSSFKPCYVYEPRSRITPYGWQPEVRPEYSHFPTWNHWPVSQAPSDGRYALVPDRVSSSAITSPRVPEPRTHEGSITRTGRFIMGLSDKPIEYMVKVAHSWLEPPEIKIVGDAFVCDGYSRDQRAFLLTKNASEKTNLEFELAAGEKSPVVNPAFVISSWGEDDAALKVNGKDVKRGRSFRLGHRSSLEGTDLIVWIKYESKEPVRISLLRVSD